MVFHHDKISFRRAFNSTESTKSEESSKEGENTTENDKATEVSETEKKLKDEVEDLKAKHADLMDKYRRSIAESDNMRKRLTKQIEDAKIFGIQGFCKDLLDVADVVGKP